MNAGHVSHVSVHTFPLFFWPVIANRWVGFQPIPIYRSREKPRVAPAGYFSFRFLANDARAFCNRARVAVL